MTSIENELKEELIEYANRLAEHGLIQGANGNVSTRLDEKHILITPTQLPKGYLRKADIVLVDDRGETIKGKHPPSMDIEFHIAAYQARPDVQAVIHAHPVITTAFTLAGKTIAPGTLPEFDYLFPKGVPVVPYRSQDINELATICSEFFPTNDIIILSHHGTLAIGRSLMMTWMVTEHLETCFEVLFYTECLQKTGPISENQINTLRDVKKRKKRK